MKQLMKEISHETNVYPFENLTRRRILRAGGTMAAVGMFGTGLGTGIVGAQDHGVLQDLCQAVQTDICVVIDVSGSMGLSLEGHSSPLPGEPSRLEVAQDALRSLVNEFDESDQVALVTFQTTANRAFNLTAMDEDGKANLNSVINGLTPVGGTNTQGGIVFGAEELLDDDDFDVTTVGADITTPSSNARPEVTKLMIVLADGVSNAYYHTTGTSVTNSTVAPSQAVAAANAAKDAGIRILTVAVGDANADAMEELATSPDDAFVDENMEDLEGVFLEIAEELCPEEIDLEIKPGSGPNSINPNSRGNVPVAVHTTTEFDATTIDSEGLRFGSPNAVIAGDGAGVSHYSFEDITGDGNDNDFIGHFSTQETEFTSDDGEGWLVGETTTGDLIAGRDSVRIVGGGRP